MARKPEKQTVVEVLCAFPETDNVGMFAHHYGNLSVPDDVTVRFRKTHTYVPHWSYNIEFYYNRLETDAELDARVEKEKQRKEANAAVRREQVQRNLEKKQKQLARLQKQLAKATS